MIEEPQQSDVDLDDVPVEGPDAPEVEDVPGDYVAPGEIRDYPRAGDTTDEDGDHK